MGAAPALLSPRRFIALGTVVVALVGWDAGAGLLPDVSHWPDVAVSALVVLPLSMTVPWLALPVSRSPALLPTTLLLLVVALLLHLAGLGSLFNVAKLLAYTGVGFLFMQVFEAVSWVVLVALVIPWVDAISVWRGPTDYVVSEQPSLFETISVSFRLPGEDASANVGPPDILFFALFLSTAARFGLRAGWTWVSMTGLLVLTLLLTTILDTGGLPALPAIAVGFLLPNADLLWRAWREKGLALGDEG